jgi:hypothetical protein
MPAPLPTAKARDFHRSQRALVAASLLACPSRDAKSARKPV